MGTVAVAMGVCVDGPKRKGNNAAPRADILRNKQELAIQNLLSE